MEEKYFTKKDLAKMFDVEEVPDTCFSDINKEALKYLVFRGGGRKMMLF